MSSSSTAGPSRPRITVAQCRGARVMLGWSQQELADKAGISVRSLVYFEMGKREPYKRTMASLIACFEAAGVEFTAGGGRVGVAVPS